MVIFQWRETATDPDAGASIKIKRLMLDCSVSETHSASAEITQHQVEVGSAVTDHIRPMPRRLSIEGFITNTPILDAIVKLAGVTAQETKKERFYASGMGLPFPPVEFKSLEFSEFDRVSDGWGVLIDAISKGTVFTHIITSLQDYENMAMSGITAPRSADRGGKANDKLTSLYFTVEFSELRFATTETVSVPARQKKQTRGHQTPTTDTDNAKDKLESTPHAAWSEKLNAVAKFLGF